MSQSSCTGLSGRLERTAGNSQQPVGFDLQHCGQGFYFEIKRAPKAAFDFGDCHTVEVIESQKLLEASGWKAEWGRRVRELRDEEGWPILSHKDRADLKPGQYILESIKRRPAFKRGISKETKAYVLE